MNKELAIIEAGRVWQVNMVALNGVKRRIRAEAEAQIEREVKVRREAAARAILYAYDQGATKTALRQVTMKDHWDFASYLELGTELARAEEERNSRQ